MPLPWLMVFFLIFFCIYSIFLMMNCFSFTYSSSEKHLNSVCNDLPW